MLTWLERLEKNALHVCTTILKKIKIRFCRFVFSKNLEEKVQIKIRALAPHVSKDYHQNQNFQGPRFWRRICADLSHFVSNFFSNHTLRLATGTWFKRKGRLRKTQHSSPLARRAARRRLLRPPPVFTSKSLKKETGFAGKTLFFFSTLLLHYVCYAFYSCCRPKT